MDNAQQDDDDDEEFLMINQFKLMQKKNKGSLVTALPFEELRQKSKDLSKTYRAQSDYGSTHSRMVRQSSTLNSA